MSKDNAIKFIELLTSDSDIQEELRDATAAYDGPKEEREVFDAVVAPIAAQAGLPFTFEEGVAASGVGRDLSEEELDAVAGGWGACYFIGASNEPDAWTCDDTLGGTGAACAYAGVTLA